MGRAIVPPYRDPYSAAPAPEEPAEPSRPGSWRSVGIEVVADLVGWTVVFLVATVIGFPTLTQWGLPTVFLVFFGLFGLVALTVHVAFLRRRRRRSK